MAELIPYVIRQGDYMTKLAHVRGFDAEEVWKDPKNDSIRAIRPNMDILAPGDVVHLPKEPKEGLEFTKESTNKYKAVVPKVDLTVTFNDDEGKPMADQTYVLEGLERAGQAESGAPKEEHKTDGSGVAKFSVPVTVREVTVRFTKRNMAFVMRVGDMDPEDESTGAQKRLVNLGYLPPDLPRDAYAAYMPSAIRSFQKDKGLPITGAFDAATLKALVDAHQQ